MSDHARDYEALPYSSEAYPGSHPMRTSAVARLFGMTPPPVETARVLELGCASGGNLIPMALSLPDAEFVGVDISPRQVEMAGARIERLGLKNARVACLDILDFDEDQGDFDYIIAHGVYSWVPQDVRDKTLRICRECCNRSRVSATSAPSANDTSTAPP